jgi:hypothetical protein
MFALPMILSAVGRKLSDYLRYFVRCETETPARVSSGPRGIQYDRRDGLDAVRFEQFGCAKRYSRRVRGNGELILVK